MILPLQCNDDWDQCQQKVWKKTFLGLGTVLSHDYLSKVHGKISESVFFNLKSALKIWRLSVKCQVAKCWSRPLKVADQSPPSSGLGTVAIPPQVGGEHGLPDMISRESEASQTSFRCLGQISTSQRSFWYAVVVSRTKPGKCPAIWYKYLYLLGISLESCELGQATGHLGHDAKKCRKRFRRIYKLGNQFGNDHFCSSIWSCETVHQWILSNLSMFPWHIPLSTSSSFTSTSGNSVLPGCYKWVQVELQIWWKNMKKPITSDETSRLSPTI